MSASFSLWDTIAIRQRSAAAGQNEVTDVILLLIALADLICLLILRTTDYWIDETGVYTRILWKGDCRKLPRERICFFGVVPVAYRGGSRSRSPTKCRSTLWRAIPALARHDPFRLYPGALRGHLQHLHPAAARRGHPPRGRSVILTYDMKKTKPISSAPVTSAAAHISRRSRRWRAFAPSARTSCMDTPTARISFAPESASNACGTAAGARMFPLLERRAYKDREASPLQQILALPHQLLPARLSAII